MVPGGGDAAHTLSRSLFIPWFGSIGNRCGIPVSRAGGTTGIRQGMKKQSDTIYGATGKKVPGATGATAGLGLMV